MRNCELCGQSFVAHKPSGKAYRGKVREGRFCSRRCAHAAARKPRQLACSMRRPEHRASDCARSPIVWARDPTKMVNGDHADLYRAELRALFADVDRGVMRPVAVARCVERLTKIGASDERPAERVERENAWALREMDKRGNSRDSAWKVAGLLTKDPHARLMYTQRFRRCRRRRRRRRARKTSTARLRKSLRARG